MTLRHLKNNLIAIVSRGEMSAEAAFKIYENEYLRKVDNYETELYSTECFNERIRTRRASWLDA
jgi:hypothetical protein